VDLAEAEVEHLRHRVKFLVAAVAEEALARHAVLVVALICVHILLSILLKSFNLI